MCSHWLSQACWLVATSLQQTCYKLDELNNLVTSCSNNLLSCCKSTTCQQVVSHKLGTTWPNNSIATTCWYACYKLVASTTCWQVVCFYVCRPETQNLQVSYPIRGLRLNQTLEDLILSSSFLDEKERERIRALSEYNIYALWIRVFKNFW